MLTIVKAAVSASPLNSPWALLPSAAFLVTWLVAQLVHECGHAHVYETCGVYVKVEAGGPPFLTLPLWVTRLLKLSLTRVRVGLIPFMGGRCEQTTTGTHSLSN